MTTQLPKFRSYGNYTSDNYGAHSLEFTLGNLTVWFSYQTPVAFQVAGQPRVVRQNDWGQTTGKHLNWVDGGAKDKRVSGSEFERLWSEALQDSSALAWQEAS